MTPKINVNRTSVSRALGVVKADSWSSEVELGAQFEQAPPHNLNRLQPLGSEPGRHIEDVAPVAQVINVEIRPHLALAYRKDPAEPDVHLLEAILIQHARREHVDRCRGRGACREGSTEKRRKLRAGEIGR